MFVVSTKIMIPILVLKLILIAPIILAVEIGESFPSTQIPKVYQLSVQSTENKTRSTTLGKEYHDEINQRGTIITWSKQGKSQITFKRRKDGQIEYFIVINDTQCTDVKIQDNRDLFLKGEMIMTTAYYLTFRADMKLMSKDEMHMGIKADRYEGVINMGGADADVEMVWFAGNPDWQFPNCPSIEKCSEFWVPLKTTIRLPQKDNDPEVLTYVYYDYKTTIDDPEIFQLPRGVSCSMLENTKAFPSNLPIHFEAGAEIYFPYSTAQITAKERIYYNMDNKMIRVDVDLPPDLIESDNAGIDKEFWDYNTEVVYQMHSKNGTCEIKSMTSSDVALGMKKKHSVGILSSLISQVIDPTAFYYVGERVYRHMKCDVWITNLTETPTEIYMKNETGLDENRVEVQYSVPVAVNISSQILRQEKVTSIMNFFNYDIKTPSWSRFDTTSCFGEEFRLRFQIELKGPYEGVIDQNVNDFILQMQKQLADKTSVLPNRFQEIMIDYLNPPNETTIVLFTTTLVENPYNAVKVGENDKDQTTNSQVYEQLDDAIFSSPSKLSFKFKTAGKTFKYSAVSIRDDIVSIPLSNQSEEITKNFGNLGPAVITKGFDFTINGISRIECFESCVSSLDFECKSWSYCKDTGNCILSSFQVEEKKNENFEFKISTNCELYTRDYIKDYVLNRETVTAAVDKELGVSYEGASDSDCARKCSIDDKLPFYCEGFDACVVENKLTCYFRSRHILEMDPTQIKPSPTCKHYTRDYAGDFIKFKNKSAAFKDFNVVVAVDSDVKNCARLCTTSADVNACKAFEICSPGGVVGKPRTQCRILDASKQEARELYDDPTCDHYTRNHFLPDRHKPLKPDDRKPSTEESKSSSSKYTGGDMAGLAFGMIFLGLLIGGLVMLGILKYKVIR